MRLKSFLLMALAIFTSASVFAGDMQRTASKKGASVYIISPANGETVASTFTVKFGLRGMGVAPAGTDKKNTGHHHLLIDGKKLPNMNKPLGKEVKHFGGGQTETVLNLSPGIHTLQLVLGDKSHIPHDPPIVSEKITVFVE